jgi:hypothetical protein
MALSRPWPVDEFGAAAYKLEVWWVDAMRGGILGVVVYSSTVMSDFTGSIGDWEVHWVPGAMAPNILGVVFRERLGSVRSQQHYPHFTEYRLMYEFLLNVHEPTGLYHGWASYSEDVYTLDDEYHAIEWYWQGPGHVMTSQYHWFTLLDVNEPVFWYRASIVALRQLRQGFAPGQPVD